MDADTPITPMSLIERALSGDEEAWTQLIGIYRTMVYMQCVNHDLQPADAAAVTNDVFTGIFQSLRSFRRDEKTLRFHRFLRRITTFKIVDHMRKSGRQLDVAYGGEVQSVDFIGVADESGLSEEQIELVWNENDFDDTLRSLQLLEAAEIFEEEMCRAYQLIELEGRSVESAANELGLLPPEVEMKASGIAEWMLKKMSELPDGSVPEHRIELSTKEKAILKYIDGPFTAQSIEAYRLKEIRGMPIPVVASILQMTEGAVRTASHRVKKWVALNADRISAEVRQKQEEPSSS